MPQGTFLGEPTNSMQIFTKVKLSGHFVDDQLDPGRSLGKTNPLNINDFKEFLDIKSQSLTQTTLGQLNTMISIKMITI